MKKKKQKSCVMFCHDKWQTWPSFIAILGREPWESPKKHLQLWKAQVMEKETLTPRTLNRSISVNRCWTESRPVKHQGVLQTSSKLAGSVKHIFEIFEHLWTWCLLTRFVYTWCLPSSTKGGRGWCSCRLIHHSKAQRHTNEIKTCTANCATLKSHTYRINQGSYMQLFQQRKRSCVLRMQIPWCSWSMAMALACHALQSGAWPPPVTPYSKVSVKTMDVAVWFNNQIIWQ